MIKKEAIAVYNPQNPIEAGLQDAYHQASGQWMTAGEMKSLTKSLSTYRGLAVKVARDPKEVGRILFDTNNSSDNWYYPCDVVDLRAILSDKVISWHAPVVLFGPLAAQKLLAQYPMCVVLDRFVAKQGRNFGSIALIETSRLYLADSVRRIVLRSYLNERQVNAVYKIVTDTYGHVPVQLMHDIPGMSYPKVASAQTGNGDTEEDMTNWYNLLKEATGPADSFDKPFLIGRLPKGEFEEEDVVKMPYETQKQAIDWKPGDRGAYRYTEIDLNANGGSGAKTKSVPLTRSLLQQPRPFTVRAVDEKNITILLDGEREEQKIPIENYVFLMKMR